MSFTVLTNSEPLIKSITLITSFYSRKNTKKKKKTFAGFSIKMFLVLLLIYFKKALYMSSVMWNYIYNHGGSKEKEKQL